MATQTAPKDPKQTFVPFIGWSDAAALFRRIAARGDASGSVLLLGPPGAGKRTMANAWISAAGDNRRLTFVDLDVVTTPDLSVPVVAVSRRLPDGVPVLHLGTGKSESYTDPPGGVLPKKLAGRFTTVIYMPELRARPIDIVALLHYYNEVVLPNALGYSYKNFDVNLFDNLLVHDWTDNARGLKNFLLASAKVDMQNAVLSTNTTGRSLGTLKPIEGVSVSSVAEMTEPFAHVLELLLGGDGLKEAADALRFKAGTEGWTFEFKDLPSLAIELCQIKCSDRVGLELEKFCLSTVTPARLQKVSIAPEALREMTFRDFVTKASTQFGNFVRKKLKKLPQLVRSLSQKDESRFSVLGTTFSSLKDGLAIRPEDVPLTVIIAAQQESPKELDDYVTLDQLAVLVGRSKRSLEKYPNELPAPRRGRPGQPNEYSYREARPVLMRLFPNRQLPETYPGDEERRARMKRHRRSAT